MGKKVSKTDVILRRSRQAERVEVIKLMKRLKPTVCVSCVEEVIEAILDREWADMGENEGAA